MNKLGMLLISGLVLAGCNRRATLTAPLRAVSAPVSKPEPSPPLPAVPKPASMAAEINISAEAAAVYDIASQQFIYTKNPDERLLPASTTKMMTMLISLEAYDPDEVITIGREAEAIGSSVDIQPGDEFKAADVIKAMMMNSGNDTAISLADHYSTVYDGFVDAMNMKAKALGMKNTHFSNVSGLEADDHYSTARDLGLLAVELMRRDEARTVVSTKTGSISTLDGKHRYVLENLNRLLWEVPGVIGVKTGSTPAAGECLVTYVQRDHDIVTVVLKSKDRFGDSAKLIDWIYTSYIWN